MRAARTLIAVAFLASFAACERGPSVAEPAIDNLVLVTIDTLRADHLGCYGYRQATSPNMDALALASIVYKNAYAHTPWTPPSHASILTGLLPPAHGLRQLWTGVLSPEITTIAEVLSADGFETAAFVSAVPLRRKVGLDQGFDHYDDGGLTMTKFSAERSAMRTTAAALAWLRAPERGQFFLWVHYFDPHFPYLHNADYELVAHMNGREVPAEDDKLQRPLFDYDSEIFMVDRGIGALMEQLELLGLTGSTAIVLTSDHGELFGEHGMFRHVGVYEEVLRVPLIVYDPRRVWDPKLEIDDVVSHVDLFATMLALLGKQGGDGGPGRVLPPFGPPLESEPFYAEHEKHDYLAYALREADWKLTKWGWPQEGAAQRTELYDLASDPEEANDVAVERPARVRDMTERLDRQRRAPAGAPSLIQAPGKSIAERLRSLGYTE